MAQEIHREGLDLAGNRSHSGGSDKVGLDGWVNTALPAGVGDGEAASQSSSGSCDSFHRYAAGVNGSDWMAEFPSHSSRVFLPACLRVELQLHSLVE